MKAECFWDEIVVILAGYGGSDGGTDIIGDVMPK